MCLYRKKAEERANAVTGMTTAMMGISVATFDPTRIER